MAAAIDLVTDLVELERLAAAEEDDDRRRRLLKLRDRLAARSEGAKVSEAANVLGLSVPTVRAWVDAGVLESVAGRPPARVTYGSLALAKHAVDELQRHRDDRPLLIAVMRQLRDRTVLDDPSLEETLEDPAPEDPQSSRLRISTS